MKRDPVRAKVTAAAALAGVLLVACTEPFVAPSEYEIQRVLCGPESAAEWASLVDECQAAFLRDRSCLGHVGIRGTLQGQQIAIQSVLVRATVSEAASGTNVPHLAGFDAIGPSPYFSYEFEAKQLGGNADEVTTQPKTLIMREEIRTDDKYVDEFADVSFRLIVGGETQNFRASGGEFSFVVPQPHALGGTFHGTFGKGNELEGCFVVFGEPADHSEE